jgi:hypothetical protein
MQMQIQIDSRRCGAGKTTTTLYNQIDTCLLTNQKAIIVVASTDLQLQYKNHYKNKLLVINHLCCTSSVSKEIVDALTNNIQLICITKQSFLMLNISDLKNGYNIIQDETLTDLIMCIDVPTYHNNRLGTINWFNHFKLSDDDKAKMSTHMSNKDYTNNTFYKLSVVKSLDDLIFKSSTHYQTIINKNYDWYISPYDYKSMYNIKDDGEDDATSFTLFGIIKADIITGYDKSCIAAAAFEKTTMYWWLRHHHISTSFLDDHTFIPHHTKIRVHHTNLLTWSLTKRKRQAKMIDSIDNQISDYIRDIIKDDSIIVLSNKDGLTDLNKYSNQININHNAHGLNSDELTSCYNISIESAILPSKQYASFLKDILLKDVEDDKDNIITHIYYANNYYQIIMRSALRNQNNTDIVNIYVRDLKVAEAMSYYFSDIDYVLIDIKDPKEVKITNDYKILAKIKDKEEKLMALNASYNGKVMPGAIRIKKKRLIDSIKKLKNQ